jgi:pilus assembly protein Flp/PilA
LAGIAEQAALCAGWTWGSFFHLTGVFVMNHVVRELKQFTLDESGATAIEYGLLAALVALGIVVGATALGAELGLFFGRIATRLSTAA